MAQDNATSEKPGTRKNAKFRMDLAIAKTRTEHRDGQSNCLIDGQISLK